MLKIDQCAILTSSDHLKSVLLSTVSIWKCSHSRLVDVVKFYSVVLA